MHYSDEEILQMFPGPVALPEYPNGKPIAEIVPKLVKKRNRMADTTEPYIDQPAVKVIGLRWYRPLGVNPFDGRMHSEPIDFEIGPFEEAGQTMRTDNIPNLSKEVNAFEVIRLLLNHDGHMDQDGNIKNYTLEPVEMALLKEEARQKSNPAVQAALRNIDKKNRKTIPVPRLDNNIRAQMAPPPRVSEMA